MRKRLLCLALSSTLISSFAGGATAAVHYVNQVGFTFQPSNLVIQQGDTVHWIWSSSGHTVTSGTGLSDPNMGLLFDLILDISSPDVEHTFLEPPGDYPYFCQPHFFLGMTGSITVEPAPPTSVEESTWGDVKRLFAR